MIAFLPRDSTNYCIPCCNRIWPRDTRPFFPAALVATPINKGKKCLACETSHTCHKMQYNGNRLHVRHVVNW